MVDDSEFIKRRHLSRGRPRKYEMGSSGAASEGALKENSMLPIQSPVASTLPEQKLMKSTKRKTSSHHKLTDHLNANALHHQQPQPSRQQQQQQPLYPAESMHYNSLGYGLPQSFGGRYLNSNEGPEFDFRMALYHDVTGHIDC